MAVSKLWIFLLIAVCIYFVLVFQLLKRKTLNLKYTLLWLASGIVMLILVVFPRLLQLFAKVVGIFDPMNALFSIALFCIVIILMSLTAIVSKLNDKNKTLTQSIALLEKRLRDVELGKSHCGAEESHDALVNHVTKTNKRMT